MGSVVWHRISLLTVLLFQNPGWWTPKQSHFSFLLHFEPPQKFKLDKILGWLFPSNRYQHTIWFWFAFHVACYYYYDLYYYYYHYLLTYYHYSAVFSFTKIQLWHTPCYSILILWSSYLLLQTIDWFVILVMARKFNFMASKPHFFRTIWMLALFFICQVADQSNFVLSTNKTMQLSSGIIKTKSHNLDHFVWSK